MPIKNKVKNKIHALKNLNWKWARKYYKKKLIMHLLFYFSLIKGKKNLEVDIDGTKCKLCFSHPYHHLFARLLAENKHERTLLSLWKKQAVESGDGVIFDIGAYNGIYGLIAGLVNPQAKVFIFEPDPINFQHIQNNIKLNNLANVVAVETAMSDRVGTIHFKRHPGATAGIIESDKNLSLNSKNDYSVQSTTINNWVAQNHRLPVLMKFDISGAEYGALLAAKEILAQAERMIIFLEFYPQQPEAELAFWSQLKELGYQWLYLYPREDGRSTYYFVFKNL